MDAKENWELLEEEAATIIEQYGLDKNARWNTEIHRAQRALEEGTPYQEILDSIHGTIRGLTRLCIRRKKTSAEITCESTDGVPRTIKIDDVTDCLFNLGTALSMKQYEFQDLTGESALFETDPVAKYVIQKLTAQGLTLGDIEERTCIPLRTLGEIITNKKRVMLSDDLHELCSLLRQDIIDLTIEAFKEKREKS